MFLRLLYSLLILANFSIVSMFAEEVIPQLTNPKVGRKDLSVPLADGQIMRLNGKPITSIDSLRDAMSGMILQVDDEFNISHGLIDVKASTTAQILAFNRVSGVLYGPESWVRIREGNRAESGRVEFVGVTRDYAVIRTHYSPRSDGAPPQSPAVMFFMFRDDRIIRRFANGAGDDQAIKFISSTSATFIR